MTLLELRQRRRGELFNNLIGVKNRDGLCEREMEIVRSKFNNKGCT
jgi:hypothetical protein